MLCNISHPQPGRKWFRNAPKAFIADDRPRRRTIVDWSLNPHFKSLYQHSNVFVSSLRCAPEFVSSFVPSFLHPLIAVLVRPLMCVAGTHTKRNGTARNAKRHKTRNDLKKDACQGGSVISSSEEYCNSGYKGPRKLPFLVFFLAVFVVVDGELTVRECAGECLDSSFVRMLDQGTFSC